ncbi:ADYC domain-containing protein [Nostoc sp. FACHB-888]|uniref:ADYC domain-containing protein n=1 Tax=Nostoc sp. FACHB-888 TaxID=2692842 RepID=UPI0016869FC7|nr:ADYC domain-containing protein [Nostoc sp. FACHB-888]MBD2248113.1 hypothetical protein [Nostoc sp. FACHB-888]
MRYKNLTLPCFIIILLVTYIFKKEYFQRWTKPIDFRLTEQKNIISNTISKGKALKGTQISGVNEQGKELRFQIRDVELDLKDLERETYLYTIFYWDKSDSQWKNLCKPDTNNDAKAIPLTGYWNATGAHVESSKLITFACTSGVLAKCVRWGYKPWKTIQGRSLRDFHQACTRMARADYCGNGKSHTKEGTEINIYDILGIQKKALKKNMVLEAAWGPDGAIYINHSRWFETLADIYKECPKKLINRINNNGDYTTKEKTSHIMSDALLFNDSLVRTRISHFSIFQVRPEP